MPRDDPSVPVSASRHPNVGVVAKGPDDSPLPELGGQQWWRVDQAKRAVVANQQCASGRHIFSIP